MPRASIDRYWTPALELGCTDVDVVRVPATRLPNASLAAIERLERELERKVAAKSRSKPRVRVPSDGACVRFR